MRAADFRIVRGFKERQRSWSADVSGVVPVEVPARFYICFGNNVYRFRSGGKRFVFRGYFQADESGALAETEGAGFGSEQQPGGSEKQAGGQKHKVFFSIAFLSLNRPERIARQLLVVIIADNC